MHLSFRVCNFLNFSFSVLFFPSPHHAQQTSIWPSWYGVQDEGSMEEPSTNQPSAAAFSQLDMPPPYEAVSGGLYTHRTQKLTRTHTHACTCTCTHKHIHTRTQTYTNTQTHTHTPNTKTCTGTHTHTHTEHKSVHTHTPNMHTQTFKATNIHARAHTPKKTTVAH